MLKGSMFLAVMLTACSANVAAQEFETVEPNAVETDEGKTTPAELPQEPPATDQGEDMPETILMTPFEARQCALWAGNMAAIWAAKRGEDPSADFMFDSTGRLYNFFVGYYEGAAGSGIDENVGLEEWRDLAENSRTIHERCAAHMTPVSARIVSWMKILQELAGEEHMQITISGPRSGS